jgi:hypothetical protein
VSLQWNETAKGGLEVACVNPASVGSPSASAPLDSYFFDSTPPGAVTTKWVEYPGRYDARCESSGGATWLDILATGGSSDHRPTVTESLGPEWGYHADDVNLALGNLVEDVAAMEAAYSSSS